MEPEITTNNDETDDNNNHNNVYFVPTLRRPWASSSSRQRHLPKQQPMRLLSKKRHRRRVVLLLDLDCFYAQCECLRLGLNAPTQALALLQWNSVLAVTYPARKAFGIKRGDGWNEITHKVQRARQESKLQSQTQESSVMQEGCFAVHVPVLTTAGTTATTSTQTVVEALSQGEENTASATSLSTSTPQTRIPTTPLQQQPTPEHTPQQHYTQPTPRTSHSPPPSSSRRRIHNPYKRPRRDTTTPQHPSPAHAAVAITSLSQPPPLPTSNNLSTPSGLSDAISRTTTGMPSSLSKEDLQLRRQQQQQGSTPCSRTTILDPRTRATNSETGNHESSAASSTTTGPNDHHDDDYHKWYGLTPAQQAWARRRELGVRRYSFQGKASLEHYRIASEKIFQTVHHYLKTTSIVLERASIDEFYLDVTDYCTSGSEDEERRWRKNAVEPLQRHRQEEAPPPSSRITAQQQEQQLSSSISSSGTPERGESNITTVTGDDTARLYERAQKETILVTADKEKTTIAQHRDIATDTHSGTLQSFPNSDNNDEQQQQLPMAFHEEQEDDVVLDEWRDAVDYEEDDPHDNSDGGDDDDDDDDDELYYRGAAVAWGIRQCIGNTLGFTLSAGIGPNKTIAKLSASYGKPNGQALTLPRHARALLDQTQLTKCRHLGGKLGKQVLALLPPDAPTTVGSIARYLSLQELVQGLGKNSTSAAAIATATGVDGNSSVQATAQWVYRLARGHDEEPVQAKQTTTNASGSSGGGGGLTKSITAFKSLPSSRTPGYVGHSVTQVTEWVQLLATEVADRVVRDAHKYHRYPKTCTFHYLPYGGTPIRSSTAPGKSLRMTFPAQQQQQPLSNNNSLGATEQIANTLRKNALQLLQEKHGSGIRVARIGLSASNFVECHPASSSSLRAFFVHKGNSSDIKGNKNNSQEADLSQEMQENIPSAIDDTCEIFSTPVATTCASATQQLSQTKEPPRKTGYKNIRSQCESLYSQDAQDRELAQKLQAQYDREDRGWQVMEKNQKRRRKSGHNHGGTMRGGKSRRIDSFFSKA